MTTDAAIIRGNFVRMQTMADGGPRIVIDLACSLRELAELELDPGAPLAIARLTQEAAQKAAQDDAQAIYGEQARELRLSGFFRSPAVWRRVGSDDEYLAWLREQPCCAPHWGSCAGDVVAAHVRRVSEGAGTGIKPSYCAIPLCHHHHSDAHQHGDSVIGTREWWDRQRIDHVQEWAWRQLKTILGAESWTQIHPRTLIEWALDNGVEQYLPQSYRDAA